MSIVKFILKAASPYKFPIFGAIFCMIIVSIIANIAPYLVKLMINDLSENHGKKVLHYGLYLIIANFALALTWMASDWCFLHFYSPLKTNVTRTIIKHISEYSYSFYQNNLTGSLNNKISDASINIPELVSTIIYTYIHDIILVSLALYLLFEINYIFSLTIFVWIVLFLIFTFYYMMTFKKLSSNASEVDSNIWGNVVDYLGGMITVRYFANRDYEINRLKEIQKTYIYHEQRKSYFLLKFYGVQGVGFCMYFLFSIWELVYLHKHNLITTGDFAYVITINFKIADQLFNLTHLLRDFVTKLGIVNQAFQILDHQIEVSDKDHAKELVVTKGKIIFDQVFFHYKGATPLFNNKSITIEAGQKVGLVGYSGSGKSTFANLILRIFNINGGKILIDDQDISEVTQNSLRKMIGIIPQEAGLFQRSIMENIRYGKLDATDDEVIEAAKAAHAHKFIMELSQNYQTELGERGMKISGGQRQRIAIARVILKNAPILILDEATSQLDSITENDIQHSLSHLMKGKTTLVIAHRLSTLLYMDRILVFENGVIVQDGTHQELVKVNGLYKTLWKSQIGGFLPERNDI